MPDRKYSLAEIDRMRAALRKTFPATILISNTGGPLKEQIGQPDYLALVEDRLRTYMLNGTEPEELEALPPHWTNDMTDMTRFKQANRSDIGRR